MEAASLPAPVGLSAARGGRLLRLRTDDQLVALFRLGNDDAFRVIHDRYRARLFAYTRQMLSGSASDAEDALQDVFLRAYGALRADGRPVTLRAWLYRVAHNRCVDHLRRPANQPTGELFENVSSLADPLADIQRRDDLRRLVEDVQRLPEQQRSALLMRELEGLSYAELADALGVTVPSVKSLLVRARIGLTEAREARDTACVEIRADLAAAHDKGVRVSGLARRHTRECSDCADYRSRLRGLRAGLAALGGSPTGLAAVAKLLGLGGAGGGAAATAGGSGGAAASGALATAGTAKVAALVCCAAVVGGSAVEASRELGQRRPQSADARRAAPRVAPSPLRADRPVAATVVPAGRPAPTARRAVPAAATKPVSPPAATRLSSTITGSAHTPKLPAASSTAPGEPRSLGGSSADEDARQAAAAGGTLAPGETSDPEPFTAEEPAQQPAPLLELQVPPTGTTGP